MCCGSRVRRPSLNVMKRGSSIVQYACAVVLIFTSIAMVAYQVFSINDVADGLLIYVAQAFLLAGSIFGLDYYVKQINNKLNQAFSYGSEVNKRSEEQQSA